MTDSPQDKRQKSESVGKHLSGFFVAIGFLVVAILIFSSGYLSGIIAFAIILLAFRVIPIPRGADAKREDEEELVRRTRELERRYSVQLHPDWPHSQSEWNETRRHVIEDKALKEMKADRRAKAEFPLNFPWWARTLMSVPWLVSAALFVADRPSNWPAFEIIPKILLGIGVLFVGLTIGIWTVAQTGIFLEKRLSKENFEIVKLCFWVALFGIIFFIAVFDP